MEIIRLQIRIKGNSVGRTVLNHKSSPPLAPLKTGAGNKSIMANRKISESGRDIFLRIWVLKGMADLRIMCFNTIYGMSPGFMKYISYCPCRSAHLQVTVHGSGMRTGCAFRKNMIQE